MAVRDRNLFVWQAYVIASSIVSLLLIVGMFFLWRAYSDKSAQFETQGQRLKSVQDEFTESSRRVDRLLSMMGIGQWSESDLQNMAELGKNDSKLQAVEQEFPKIQTLFPANTPLADKNLLKLPQALMETIRKRNEELADMRNRTTALQTRKEKEVADHRSAQRLLKQPSNRPRPNWRRSEPTTANNLLPSINASTNNSRNTSQIRRNTRLRWRN